MEQLCLESLPPEVLTAVASTNTLLSFICTSRNAYEVVLHRMLIAAPVHACYP